MRVMNSYLFCYFIQLLLIYRRFDVNILRSMFLDMGFCIAKPVVLGD